MAFCINFWFLATEEEQINADVLHKAIVLNRGDVVERILSVPEGKKLLEIPDKFGCLPLLTAVNLKNIK